jgi:hypothetical protein
MQHSKEHKKTRRALRLVGAAIGELEVFQEESRLSSATSNGRNMPVLLICQMER